MFAKDRLIVPLMTGAANMTISIDRLATVPIEFPSLPEQKRIVELLNEVDQLRLLRSTVDHRVSQLVPGLFHEMFGDSSCVEKTIGQLLDQKWLLIHKDGNHGSLYPRSTDFGKDGVPFLSATCVNDDGTVDHSRVKYLRFEKAEILKHGWIEKNDVLLAHNASVGAVAFYEGEYKRAIIGTSLTAFRANPQQIEPRFLWAALRDRCFQRQLERIMKQALRNQVPITAQRELFLKIPPLPLQSKFVDRLVMVGDLARFQTASRGDLDRLFEAITQDSFNGQ
jgi:type I restriction enzyme S subunit